MNRIRLAGACIAITAVIATGCSDDGDATTSSSTTSSSSAPTNSTGTIAGTGTTTTNVTSTYGPNPQPAVGVGTASRLGPKVFATVTKVEPVELKANGPGDTAGPGVLVTLDVRNASDQALDLGGLIINAHYGENVPASALRSAPNNDPLSGKLAPSASKSGRYAFRVPPGETGVIVLDVHQVGQPNTVIVDTRV